MRCLPTAALIAVAAGGCASRLSGASNEELVRDLVEIRPFDGHTGFSAPDGPKSYGWEAKEVLVERAPASVPSLAAALRDPALDVTQRRIVRGTIGEIGLHAGKAVPALVQELDTADGRTAADICLTLRRIGPAATPAVPRL